MAVANIEFRVCRRAGEYAALIPEVSQLFSMVFERPFPAEAWDQWYLNNPDGEPMVALGYHEDRLVAHHAFLPQTLLGSAGDRLRYCLSVSTMVHPEFRRLQAFMQMVDSLHEEAGKPDAGFGFVLAFPNARSAPLFEQLYGYKPILLTELSDWKPALSIARGVASWNSTAAEHKPRYSVPGDEAYWNWRTRNNHAKSRTTGGKLHLVYKVMAPATLMLLDARPEGERDAAECVSRFATDLGLTEVRLTKYHAALLGIPDAELRPHEGYVVRFYGFPLTREVPDIQFNLLLSDVV